MTSTDVIFTLVRAIIYQDLTKNLATHFWQHIIDVWHVPSPSVYNVACKGLSGDRGHGPNKPTSTIIGEYSFSYHDGAH